MNIVKASIIITSFLGLLGCESTTGESVGFDDTLNKKMTHSYCYQYMYGGYSSSIDYDKASFWCGKAIMDANPKAMSLMAEIYFLGLGQTVDHNKAFYWYEQAAELGHSHAQFMLAHMYHNGLGVMQSTELATQWNDKARFNNHPHAERQKRLWTKTKAKNI